jgi:hypothetical protein
MQTAEIQLGVEKGPDARRRPKGRTRGVLLYVTLPNLGLLVAVLVLAGSTAAAQTPTARPGVPPQDAWTCPLTHSIKGNFTTYSGERCIYHLPGGEFYSSTKPERCYASETDAVKDGCRRSQR